MLRSQNPAFFIPSRYHSLPVRTIYPAKHAGIPGKVLCVRNRQTADPEKQNGKRQLLPFDLSCYRKRNPAARRKRECAVNLGAGLPLAGFGREKKAFREYLFRSSQPVSLKFEGISYQAAIQDLSLFPQVCSAIAVHPEFIRGEPSVLLMDIGGWTVGLMRLDNGIPNASACRGLELPHFLSCQSPLF